MSEPTGGLRILHTSPFVPFPLDSGGKLVTHHHLTGLARAGHRVTFLAPLRRPTDPAAVDEMAKTVRAIPVPVRAGSRLGIARRFVLDGVSARVARHTLPAVEKAIDRLLEREEFDVAILDSLFTAHLLERLRRRAPRLPVLLVDHNVESDLFRRFLARQGVAARAVGRWELARIRRAEARAVREFDEVVALSPQDRDRLLALAPGGRVTVLPPGAPVRPGESIPPPSRPKSLLFLGSYRWEPNREAARWLAEEIFPRVRAEVPDAVLHLAGEDPGGALRACHRPEAGVHVLGRVPDATATIREAAIFVVPLRVGGGVRLKILEAFANERPVVTTTLGGEGIPLGAGVHAVVADGTEAIARETVRLLADPERAGRIAREGRGLVEREYGWDAIVARLDAIVRRLAAG